MNSGLTRIAPGFSERRVEEVARGWASMTLEERDSLVADMVTKEACPLTEEDLRVLSDKSLMNMACWIWSQ